MRVFILSSLMSALVIVGVYIETILRGDASAARLRDCVYLRLSMVGLRDEIIDHVGLIRRVVGVDSVVFAEVFVGNEVLRRG